MLGPAGPESEGFSVRPSRHYTVAKHQLSSTMPMCEDPARILAVVQQALSPDTFFYYVGVAF